MVTQTYDEALKPSGLKSTQFSLLAVLDGIGTVPLSQLADSLVMDRTTLSRNLKPLTDKQLVEIRHGEDRRVRQIALTDQGRAALAKARPLWDAVQSRMVARFGEDRWAGFIDDLTVATEAATT